MPKPLARFMFPSRSGSQEPMRLVHARRLPRSAWAGCLPVGEMLVMAALGLALVLA